MENITISTRIISLQLHNQKLLGESERKTKLAEISAFNRRRKVSLKFVLGSLRVDAK